MIGPVTKLLQTIAKAKQIANRKYRVHRESKKLDTKPFPITGKSLVSCFLTHSVYRGKKCNRSKGVNVIYLI